MPTYLGETLVDWKTIDKFKDFTPTDWALYYIRMYGQVDGSHHSKWVIDQIARILTGSTITVKLARWSDGQFEYRVDVDENCKAYKEWREDCDQGYDEGRPS